MKKKKIVIIIVSVLLILALLLGGGFLYFRTTPEYALLCTLMDIKDQGIRGLQGHVSGDAKVIVDKLCATGDGGWLSILWGYASKTDFVSAIINECEKIQWKLEDIQKGKKNATVVVRFNYRDKFTGTIDLFMVKQSGQWTIDGLGFPDFD